MKFNKLAFVVAFVLAAVLFAEVALHAEEANQSPTITSSQLQSNTRLTFQRGAN
jgi:hypothetical protein